VKATEVTTGLAESNGSLLPGLWRDSLHITCGLTACTLGSAPGPTLGNEYGKTLPSLHQFGDDVVLDTLIKQQLSSLSYVQSVCNTRQQQLSDGIADTNGVLPGVCIAAVIHDTVRYLH